MKTPSITVLIGSPGAGKSFYAKKAIQLNPNLVRINRDDFRMSLFGKYYLDKKEERFLTKMLRNLTTSYLKQGHDIILDNTHCNFETLNEVAKVYNAYADIHYMIFDTDWETKVERNNAREVPVPADVMLRMHKVFEMIKGSFDFTMKPKKSTSLEMDVTKPKAIVFDLDNTLSTTKDRGPYEYHKALGDNPIESSVIIAELLEYDFAFGDPEIEDRPHVLYVTGRDDSSADVVKMWLEEHVATISDSQLFMRKTGDMRSSAIVKEEILLTKLVHDYNIIGWFDDDLGVVEMLKLHGIQVFNTNQN